MLNNRKYNYIIVEIKRFCTPSKSLSLKTFDKAVRYQTLRPLKGRGALMAQPKSSIIRYDEVLNTHLEGVLKHCMFSKKHRFS